MTRVARQREPRGLILPMMLVIIMLLALLGMAFSLMTNAELGAAEVRANRMQTRLAAEAGLQRIQLLLRKDRANTSTWWNNRQLHRMQIFPRPGKDDGIDSMGPGLDVDVEKIKQSGTRWLCSLVAIDLDNLKVTDKPIRFGIQDEAGKLNINWATREQLMTLFGAVLRPDLPIEEYVDALIDWRDKDESTSPAGAESDYYRQLTPPYSAANAPLKTIEEMLLIKGFKAQVVYGEDFNRNGILEVGEDDGMTSFPPDDADGELSVGILPYVSVYSMSQDRAHDNKPRIYMNAKPEELEAILGEMLESDLANFIVQARKAGHVFQSPADLASPIEIKGAEGTPELQISPADLLIAMDRLTTIPRPSNMGPLAMMFAAPLPHVINVNTAPPPVLACLGLDDEQIERIVTTRSELSDAEKISPAWLINADIMAPEELARFTGPQLNALRIVTQSWQFTVESVGFGDHVGMVCRLQAVIEMQGQVPLIKYVRDLTRLGPGWPIRAEEESREITSQTG